MDIEKLAQGDYGFILENVGEFELNTRYNTIYEFLKNYIQTMGLESDVIISRPLLDNMVIDYFVDIHRIKTFQDIDNINDAKILAYTAYWLLRRKPLQLVKEEADNDLCFINERMVAAYIYSSLFSNPRNISIVEEKQEAFQEFEKHLLYSFMFRDIKPKMIEIIIYAFQAGRSYQYSVDFDN